MEEPLYPLSLYIYNPDGTYGEPIQINSKAQLHGPGTKMLLNVAMRQGVEIRMTDPLDQLVFHVEKGRVVFPQAHTPS